MITAEVTVIGGMMCRHYNEAPGQVNDLQLDPTLPTVDEDELGSVPSDLEAILPPRIATIRTDAATNRLGHGT